jgi:hypothetical protein
VVSFVMAWSPFQRANAGIIWVEQPGDYANPIPTAAATGPPGPAEVSSRRNALAHISLGLETDRRRFPPY